MPAHTPMSVETYRRATFDGADRDYVDGELWERNMGELEHSTLQLELALRLRAMGGLSFDVKPEIRVQTSASRFRVADLAVWRRGQLPSSGIPPVPPFLVVEILSPEDRMVRMQVRVQEYLTAGVQAIWIVDPYDRAALIYTPARPQGQKVDVLETADPPIAIPLDELWTALES